MIIKAIFITINKNILNFLSLFDISKKRDCAINLKPFSSIIIKSLRIHNTFLSFLKFCINSPEDAWHGTAAGGAEQETSMMRTMMTENVCGLSGSISRNSCHRRTWETRTFFFFLKINV